MREDYSLATNDWTPGFAGGFRGPKTSSVLLILGGTGSVIIAYRGIFQLFQSPTRINRWLMTKGDSVCISSSKPIPIDWDYPSFVCYTLSLRIFWQMTRLRSLGYTHHQCPSQYRHRSNTTLVLWRKSSIQITWLVLFCQSPGATLFYNLIASTSSAIKAATPLLKVMGGWHSHGEQQTVPGLLVLPLRRCYQLGN